MYYNFIESVLLQVCSPRAAPGEYKICQFVAAIDQFRETAVERFVTSSPPTAYCLAAQHEPRDTRVPILVNQQQLGWWFARAGEEERCHLPPASLSPTTPPAAYSRSDKIPIVLVVYRMGTYFSLLHYMKSNMVYYG